MESLSSIRRHKPLIYNRKINGDFDILVKFMKIRKAQRKDAEVITMQNILLAKESEQMTLKQEKVLAGVKALLADATKGFYLVVEDKGGIIGQAMVTVEWSDWRNKPIWWVQSVFVQKEWRRKHVFTRLLQTIRILARKQGVAFLRLYVHDKNRPAACAYEKSGWTREAYTIYEHSV
jgi:GNAT superfamily N-acetyltransferase